jgi:hypothetical protein
MMHCGGSPFGCRICNKCRFREREEEEEDCSPGGFHGHTCTHSVGVRMRCKKTGHDLLMLPDLGVGKDEFEAHGLTWGKSPDEEMPWWSIQEQKHVDALMEKWREDQFYQSDPRDLIVQVYDEMEQREVKQRVQDKQDKISRQGIGASGEEQGKDRAAGQKAASVTETMGLDGESVDGGTAAGLVGVDDSVVDAETDDNPLEQNGEGHPPETVEMPNKKASKGKAGGTTKRKKEPQTMPPNEEASEGKAGGNNLSKRRKKEPQAMQANEEASNETAGGKKKRKKETMKANEEASNETAGGKKKRKKETMKANEEASTETAGGKKKKKEKETMKTNEEASKASGKKKELSQASIQIALANVKYVEEQGAVDSSFRKKTGEIKKDVLTITKELFASYQGAAPKARDTTMREIKEDLMKKYGHSAETLDVRKGWLMLTVGDQMPSSKSSEGEGGSSSGLTARRGSETDAEKNDEEESQVLGRASSKRRTARVPGDSTCCSLYVYVEGERLFCFCSWES